MLRLSDNVTVCIFVYNEQRRLERCINNFKGLFDILVIDNDSTDNTREVAASLGCRSMSIRNPGFIETPEVMDPVLTQVATDYILVALAGEFIPITLLEKYAEVANSRKYEVVKAFRISITAGMPIPISGLPGPGSRQGQMRFFRKGGISYFGNQVHGSGRVMCADDKVLSLVADEKRYFYQFRDYDVSWTERNHATYNDVLAKQRFDSGTRFSWLGMLFHSTKEFFNSYIRFGSCRFGALGFIHSYYRFHMEVGIWLRVWEHENALDRNGVIAANKRCRDLLEASDKELRSQRGME